MISTLTSIFFIEISFFILPPPLSLAFLIISVACWATGETHKGHIRLIIHWRVYKKVGLYRICDVPKSSFKQTKKTIILSWGLVFTLQVSRRFSGSGRAGVEGWAIRIISHVLSWYYSYLTYDMCQASIQHILHLRKAKFRFCTFTPSGTPCWEKRRNVGCWLQPLLTTLLTLVELRHWW